MKKLVVLFLALSFVFVGAEAAKKEKKGKKKKIELIDSKDVNVVMKFNEVTHDFGNITEGIEAKTDFTFTNFSTSQLIINSANPSCGCTTPSFTKEPVEPGGNGVITAVYNTKGRPGPFTKTINVSTNFGNLVLTISGTVVPAPTGSAPDESSLLKTH